MKIIILHYGENSSTSSTTHCVVRMVRTLGPKRLPKMLLISIL